MLVERRSCRQSALPHSPQPPRPRARRRASSGSALSISRFRAMTASTRHSPRSRRASVTGCSRFPMRSRSQPESLHSPCAAARCAQCYGKLGLGVRSRILWNGRWWIHVRYCSTHCEALHELERRQRQTSLVHLFPLSQQSAGLTDQDAAKRCIQRRGGRFDARQAAPSFASRPIMMRSCWR
jgi:hypothetical protein